MILLPFDPVVGRPATIDTLAEPIESLDWTEQAAPCVCRAPLLWRAGSQTKLRCSPSTPEDCVEGPRAGEYWAEHLPSRNRSQTLTCPPSLADGAQCLDGKTVN